jgi:2-phospho-L-lactate guanylyltransferase
MKLCIVPMKPLVRAKARLAELLSPEQRRSLSLAMLGDVVRAAHALDVVWVLHSDDDAAEVARAAGAQARLDPSPDGGLNPSLEAVTAQAVEAGAAGVLVLAADCPAATGDDVRAMAIGPGVTLAPNLDATGTNGLWRMPPDAIPTFFGPNSRLAHESYARTRGIPFAIVPRAGLGLDVDRPRDLDAAWRAPSLGEATRDALRALGYPQRAGR